MASPAKRMRLSSQRASLSGNRQNVTVATPSQSALRTSQNSGNRVPSALSQSTSYDIVTGQPLEQPATTSTATATGKPRRPSFSQSQQPAGTLKRSTSRASLLPQPTQPVATVSQQKYQDDMLAMQTRVNKLEYELRNLESEKAMIALQHDKELSETQARADHDHKKYQEAEDERLKALRAQEAAQKELRDIRDRGVNDSASIEKKSRDLRAQVDLLKEERDDLETQLAESQREMQRLEVEVLAPLRSQVRTLSDEAAAELDDMKSRFETVNRKLQEKEAYTEELEKKVLDLNSKSGGNEELDVLKREFSDQIENVRRLETVEREQRSKIRRLEDERRSVNVVLEEKRALEVQNQVLQDSERRAAELEMQKEILEDEKRTWTTLLEKEGEEGQYEFDTPEAVVKALVNVRITHALTLERLGTTEAELIGKDEALRAIQSERDALRAQFNEVKESHTKTTTSTPEPESKAVKRLEGQLQLAKKEVNYLRAQLDTFNTEEETMTDVSNFDNAKSQQIVRLEALLTEYKSQVDALHTQISTLETQPAPATPVPQLAGQKRPAQVMEADSEQIGYLTRKNKNLVVALEKMTAQTQALAKELQASRSQLKALRASHSQRVLELRENPTAQHQAVQASTLRVLKQENEDLKVQLYGDDEARRRVRVVPVSQLESLKLDLQAMEKSLADKTKRLNRNTEIWSQKAAEFRDVIASVLGYKVTFLPNGKVKVRSMYHKILDENGQEVVEDEDDREDYIEFDGERGTMKVGGGREGPFGQEIAENLDYWVKSKNEIPCFLAAVNLEFQDKYGSMLPPPEETA